MGLPWVPRRTRRPWAAVHRGPHQVPGCPEAAARLLARAGLRARFVGRGERLSLADALRRGPTVLVQPGGGELDTAWTELAADRETVRDYVAGGGRYLGLCLGGYLAGRTPGYGLLPGDTDQLVRRSGSPLRRARDGVVEVVWDGQRRSLYAEDPPVFLLDGDRQPPAGQPVAPGPATVVATYPNGDVAALVCPFGDGRVAVVGPHPEATDDWFTDAGLAPVHPDGSDLGQDLLRRLGIMER